MSELLKQFSAKKEVMMKQYSSPFNPFNSWKFMFHTERMWRILEWLNSKENNNELLPPPTYVTVDPTDICNHSCPWCISSEIQELDNTTLDSKKLQKLPSVISSFTRNIKGKFYSINAVVLAGGGEPLVNPNTRYFIENMSYEIKKCEDRISGPLELSMITNGELLTEYLAELLAEHATWVGFSVDAGNSDSHKKMHRPKNKNSNVFLRVIENIRMLADIKKKFNRKIPLNIGYKFNIHPDSYESMIEAARVAKEIGCDEIQFKPTYMDNAFEVMPQIIDEAQKNIYKARDMYEDNKFKVHGVIHKFGPSWEPNHDFNTCTTTPLGLIFSADSNMYLCCDRRGDPSLNLGKWNYGNEYDNLVDLDSIKTLWGSEKHRNLIKNINVNECPRCTFYHYNKTVQEAFINDNMNRNFL